MKISDKGLALIKSYEGLKLQAYKDGGGVWTIGYGTTKYPNGNKVKQGDVCTLEQAELFLNDEVDGKTKFLNTVIKSTINQNQFDSVSVLTYNIGSGAFGNSTLLKKINKNPFDPSIRDEFLKWNHDNGKVVAGLTKRRIKEADLYFS